MAAGTEEHFDLLGYLSVLWRKKWIVVILTVLAVGTALVLSYLQSPTYVSSSKVLVNSTALNTPGSAPLASTISMPTEAQIATSQPVAEIAAQKMGGGTTASDVRDHTTVSYPPDAYVLQIAYSAGDAATAQKGAQSVAEAYLDNRKAQAMDAANKAIENANEQISQLRTQADAAAKIAASAPAGSPAQIAAANKAQQLNGQIAIWQNNIALINLQSVNPGEILSPAGLPSQPATPDHKKDAARGLLVGLVVGIAAALFIDATQRRKRRA